MSDSAFKSSKELQPGKPVIWVIDREQWPRAYLRAELIERGYDVLGFLNLSQAVSQLLRKPGQRPEAIVLELNGQWITRRSLRWMTCAGVPVIGITGALELNHPRVGELKWAALLRRPITIGRVVDAIEKIVPLHTGQGSGGHTCDGKAVPGVLPP